MSKYKAPHVTSSPSDAKECPACDGKGIIFGIVNGQMRGVIECPVCDGAGWSTDQRYINFKMHQAWMKAIVWGGRVITCLACDGQGLIAFVDNSDTRFDAILGSLLYSTTDPDGLTHHIYNCPACKGVGIVTRLEALTFAGKLARQMEEALAKPKP